MSSRHGDGGTVCTTHHLFSSVGVISNEVLSTLSGTLAALVAIGNKEKESISSALSIPCCQQAPRWSRPLEGFIHPSGIDVAARFR
jgi:hypothetical protein